MDYARLIRAAMQQPWAITTAMAATITDLLRFRAAGGRFTADEIRARIGAAADEERPTARRQGLVAVIPIWGVIAHRTFEASSGMTSTETIRGWLKRAVADEEVTAILLDISSPGGTVDGVPELATEIFNARKVKPVVAIANSMAASAAYWLGSQAEEFVVIPSGQVGSVGVYMLFEDWSEHLAKEGVKYQPISAGEHKLEGAFWEPMSEETRAHFQASVDAVYADFLKAIARGRGTTVADVKKNFGGGRVYDAADAKARGMVDRVETFDQTLARLMKTPRRSGAGRVAVADVRAKEDAPTRVAEESPDESAPCEACHGTGLKPERSMGDPQGQETCEACGGTGKELQAAAMVSQYRQVHQEAEAAREAAPAPQPVETTADRAQQQADQDAIDIILALR